MNKRDISEIETAARLLISIIERARVQEENAIERRGQFMFVEPPKNKKRGNRKWQK